VTGFIYKKSLEVKTVAARTWNLAQRLEFKKIKNKKIKKAK